MENQIGLSWIRQTVSKTLQINKKNMEENSASYFQIFDK